MIALFIVSIKTDCSFALNSSNLPNPVVSN